MGLIAGVLAAFVFGLIFFTRAFTFTALVIPFVGPFAIIVVPILFVLFIVTGVLIGWGLGFKLLPF